MPPSATRRVLFLNDVGFQYGAGIAQARQMQSLLLLGWEVAALAWEPGDVQFEQLLTRADNQDNWLGMRRVRHLDPRAPMADEEIIAGILLEVSRSAPEIIIAGNLHAPSWPLRLLPALRQLGSRVIAYMHDGYLFSGRCAYPGQCQLYLTGCNETCPTAHEYPVVAPERIHAHWRLRREIFNGPDGIEVAANSHWTRGMFTSALPGSRSCETLYLGADETVFQPGDKTAARQLLGLPEDRPVVLCAAVNFQERRKGSPYLQEIAATLHGAVTFAALGHNAEEIPGLIGLGYHLNPHYLAATYQAADLYLGTALEEAFGQTIMEAQLCGVPVVAFGLGGVPEIVTDGTTGVLRPAGDVAGIVTAIRALLADAARLRRMGEAARAAAQPRFSLQAQARRWQAYLDHGATGHGSAPADQVDASA